MVFGPVNHNWGWVDGYGFQFPLGIRWCSDEHTKGMKFGKTTYFNSPWELDGVRTLKMNVGLKRNQNFNSPWELDGVRTGLRRGGGSMIEFNFNSPWELDGVRTISVCSPTDLFSGVFQFPLGIRWCSDKNAMRYCILVHLTFNSLWELDGVRTYCGWLECPDAADTLSIPCGN